MSSSCTQKNSCTCHVQYDTLMITELLNYYGQIVNVKAVF